MKYFIINIHYTASPERLNEVTPDHRAYLKTKYDEGIMIFSGPRVPRTAGFLFARAENISIIEDMIINDPFKINKIADYEIIEIAPVLWAPELNKIFENA